MSKEARIIFFSEKQKKIIGPNNLCYYDGKEFTSDYPAGSETNFDDVKIIFEGVPDPSKFSYK
jgi:hypothetical protein